MDLFAKQGFWLIKYQYQFLSVITYDNWKWLTMLQSIWEQNDTMSQNAYWIIVVLTVDS